MAHRVSGCLIVQNNMTLGCLSGSPGSVVSPLHLGLFLAVSVTMGLALELPFWKTFLNPVAMGRFLVAES